MNKEIAILIELQSLDTKLIALGRNIDTIPQKIQHMQKPLKDATAALEREKQRLNSAVKKRKDRETDTSELKEKIIKLQSRSSEIKTNKEYQAHLREIEAREKELSVVESAIKAIADEISSAQNEVKNAEKTLQEETMKIEALQKEIQSEIEQEKVSLATLKAKRPGLVKQIDSGLYNSYMRLLEDKDGLAVAQAANEICQGCNMNIPPQLFVELKVNEELILCPQCKRIIFYLEAGQ